MICGAADAARGVVIAAVLLLVGGGAWSTASELQQHLAAARATCDLDAASGTLAAARAVANDSTDPDTRELLARSALLVAELLRMEYEAGDGASREERLLLGRRIDTAAREGLGALDGLPESSERQRLRGDLLATMIRSKLRAKKYRRAMEDAAERARQLDPDNPHALVTAAKLLIYADDEHGGDLDAALLLLDQALDLDPELDSARFLRAGVRQLLGDAAGAAADRAELARRRPMCPPPPPLVRMGNPRAEDDSTSETANHEVN